MQKHSAVLIKLLAERGIQLTVIHPGGKEYSDEKLHAVFPSKANLEFIRVPFPVSGKLPGHYLRENQHYSSSCLKAVEDRISDFDLIYVQGFTGSAFMKLRGRKKMAAPVLLNLHGFEMFQKITGVKNKLANYLLRREAWKHLKQADYVYSFGGQIDRILIDLKIPVTKILSQANGIEESWLVSEPVKHEPRTFVFIGRNERRKGLFELNESIRSLLGRADLKFNFHFVGPIPDSEKISSKQIMYHGEIRDTEKIKAVLDAGDCIVVPSYSEGMPTVILEAMARGLAVIATNVGAVSRMIDGNGILIETPDVSLISDALIALTQKDEMQLNQMKKKSIEMVRDKYSWPAVADSKMNDFRRIIQR